MTLNADKCKVMNIDCHGKELSVVSSAMFLGVTLSSDRTWSDHVNAVGFSQENGSEPSWHD